MPKPAETPAPAGKMPSDTLIPDTPAAWFNNKFHKLAEKYGQPICEETKHGKFAVRDICEDFFGAWVIRLLLACVKLFIPVVYVQMRGIGLQMPAESICSVNLSTPKQKGKLWQIA